ncbi:MAG: DarT ssDNA thymidine ADP-ribosyltransferase family protein, partial [Pseudonocardiaceae bacterium]
LIQARREPVVSPGTGGRKLHSYANLYVNARNKMLSKIKYDHGDLGVCVLRVSLDVLDLAGTVVSSQNASSDWARFAAAPGGLALIDKDLVFERSWKHPDDQKAEWRHGSIMCAEVLVPDCVAPEYIEGAYVSCAEAAEALLDAADQEGFAITSNADLFFRT